MLRRLVLVLLLAAAPALAADAPTFEATGRAPIAGGDRVRARERALDDAFQHAIEGAVGALLGTDVLVKKASDLRLKILPRARGYVQSFRVIDEGEHEPNVFSVQISADIAADRLVRELADKTVRPSKTAAKSSARVLLCGSGASDSPPRPTFVAALRGRLANGGFELLQGTRCDEQGLAGELAATGARGALVVELAGNQSTPIRGTSLVGLDQKLTIHLLDATGKRWADAHADGVGYGPTPDAAMDAAALQALPEVMTTLEAALAPQQDTARGGLSVRVLGVRRYPQLTAVRNALERLSGVDAVEPRRFNPGVPGSIELLVRTALPVRSLVDGLRRVSATYQFNVREIDGAVIVDVPDAADPGAGVPETRSPQ